MKIKKEILEKITPKKILKTLAVIVPLLILLILMGRIILKPGYLIHTDVTEGLHIDRMYQRYIYTYSDDWGESYPETARIPLFYLTKTVYDLTGLPDSYYVKIKFLILITLSYAVFTFFTYKWLKFIRKGKKDVLLPTLAASIFYLTNYWFTNRLMHFYLFFASCTLPITFYYFYTYLFSKEEKPQKLVILGILLGIFSATPHTILFEVLIGTALTIVFLITQRENRIKRLLRLGLFSFGYILINLYWLLPTITTQAKPDKVLSVTIVDMLSQNASLFNSVRLMGFWMTPLREYFLENSLVNVIQQLLTIVPLFIALGTTCYLVIKRRSKLALILMILIASGVFLSSKTPLSTAFYQFIMFNSPLANLGWAFREYDKFGIIVAFGYSLSIGIIFTALNDKFRIPIVPVYILLIVSNLYFYQKTIDKKYIPQQVPNEFFQTIEILQEDPELANAVWYPGNPNPSWAKTTSVSYFLTNFSSPKPTLAIDAKIINYLSYLGRYENAYRVDMSKALDLIGAKYFVLRQDNRIFTKASYLEEALDMQENLEKLMDGNYLSVYRNKSFTGLIKNYENRIITNQGLNVLKDLSDLSKDPSNSYIEFTDKPNTDPVDNVKTYYYFPDGQYIDLAINDYLDKFIFPAKYSNYIYTGETDRWRKSSLENETHAESEYFLGFFGINISQFDYKKGILSANEGVVKKDKSVAPAKSLYPKFNEDPKGKLEEQSLINTAGMDEFTYPWTSIISDFITLDGTRALEIKAKVKMDRMQEPHLKIFLYDEEENYKDIKYLFPDYEGNINAIVKLDQNITYATLGIWFKPYTLEKDQVLIEKLTLKDITNNYKDIEFYFKDKPNCSGTCTVYARVLESASGGKMGVKINDSEFVVNTLIDHRQKPQKYTWIEVGEVNLPISDEESNIHFISHEGFNSVNALVFLDQSEKVGMENRISQYSEIPTNLKKLSPSELAEREKITSEKTKVNVKKVNPTKYEVSSFLKPNTLALSVPYNENWKITEAPEEETILINGLLPGWKVENKEKVYTIEFTPQKKFHIGAIISSVTAIAGIGLYIYLALKKREASDRISKFQG